MAIDIDQSFYRTGTATVANGATVVTGTGTQWNSSIRANDLFGTHVGDPVRILSVDSNTSMTLAYPWSGPSQTDGEYEVQFTPYDTGYYPAVRQLLTTLTSGNVEAFANLVGVPDGIPMFTGPGAMTVINKSELISGVSFDVQVDTIAERDAYDDRPSGFSVLVSDVGDGRSALFIKNSLTSGDWSDPSYLTGPVGPLASINVGTTTTTAPGTDATVTNSGTPTAPVLDFGIPAGKGFQQRGNYSASVTYVEGDVVYYNGSSWIAKQETTGNAPPTLPITSDANWQLLAQMGQGGDMFKATYDPTNQNRDIFAEIKNNIMSFDNINDAKTKDISPNVNAIIVFGYYDYGDGGLSFYKRVATEPTHLGKFQNTDGSWWSISDLEPNIKMFGAKGDNSFDNTSAINSSISYCYSHTNPLPLKINNGLFRYSGPITDLSKPILVTGMGQRNSILIPTTNNAGLFIRGASGVRSANVTLTDFAINGSLMTANNALVIDFAQATTLTDFAIYDPFNGIYMQQMGNAVFNNVTVDGNVRGTYCWKAFGSNVARNGQNDQIDVIQFNNCLVQGIYQGNTTVPSAEGLVVDGRVHSIQFNGMRCLSLLRGFVSRNTPGLPKNFAPSFIKGSGLETENTYAEGILLEAGNMIEPSDVFVARAFRASGIVVGAACSTIKFSGVHSATNYYHGIDNQGAASLTIIEPSVYNNSQAQGNTYSGVKLGNSGRTFISGGLLGKLEGVPAYTENQKHAIQWDSGFTGEIRAIGVNLIGNATSSVSDTLGTPSDSSYIKDCPGYNPGTTVSLTVPASGGSIKAGLRDEFINVFGGSGLTVSIDGVFIANSTPAAFLLPARKVAVINYVTAPLITSTRM